MRLPALRGLPPAILRSHGAPTEFAACPATLFTARDAPAAVPTTVETSTMPLPTRRRLLPKAGLVDGDAGLPPGGLHTADKAGLGGQSKVCQSLATLPKPALMVSRSSW